MAPVQLIHAQHTHTTYHIYVQYANAKCLAKAHLYLPGDFKRCE